MYIPSHVGLESNELVDERARHMALELQGKWVTFLSENFS
jgi:hypothetical protein